jgi:medium-chain acyl-[acyl-carrier-protein] hydrolase
MKNAYALSQPEAPAWFSFPKPNPRARLRLFCFPYAGGGANIFYRWPGSLPESVELCLVHLPGRQQRINEPPFERLSEMMEAIERPLLPYLDKPLALFGHSMGGLISFELSRHLRRNYGVQPSQLFVSGCGAPQRSQALPPIQSLPPDRFLVELGRVIGVNGRMTANSQLAALMLPTLKADFALCQTYSYTPEPPLDCAMSVYGGLRDVNVKYEHLEGWREETTGAVAIHLFGGDHFFIHTAEPLLLDRLSKDLHDLAGRVG